MRDMAMKHKSRSTKEKGQALILVVVALSLVLLAGIGLAIDVSQLYSHRQMAQNAADAAALAAIMSIFDGTNTTNATFNNTFGNITTPGTNPAQLKCGSNDNHTPCYYARQNGFDPAFGDNVFVDFWAQVNAFTREPGVSISNAAKDPVPLLRVTVIRPVPATLMRLVGGGTKNVAAQAMAAIVTSISPIPILIMHPTATGALKASGTGNVDKIRICGGPKRSIQVNSCGGTGSSIAKPNGSGSASCGVGNANAAFTWNGQPVVDLSKAGPFDTGGCATGTGGDFGISGLPAGPVGSPSPLNLGSVGQYLQPASAIADPLINVPAPVLANLTAPHAACTEVATTSATPPTCNDLSGAPVACPPAATGLLATKTPDPAGAAVNSCTVLYPGIYDSATQYVGNSNGFTFDNKVPYAIFTPGIYYIKSGGANFNQQATGQTQFIPTTLGVYPTCNHPNSDTGCGVLFYLAANGINQNAFNVNANAVDLNFLGSDPLKQYQKIVIFADHASVAQNHTFGGGGTWNVTGTVYLTNTVNTLLNTGSLGQSFGFQGNPLSGTVNGQIIVDRLDLGGTPNITMNLDATVQQIRQIALVR